MSLFEEPRPEPQTEPEKPKRSKKKLLSTAVVLEAAPEQFFMLRKNPRKPPRR